MMDTDHKTEPSSTKLSEMPLLLIENRYQLLYSRKQRQIRGIHHANLLDENK